MLLYFQEEFLEYLQNGIDIDKYSTAQELLAEINRQGIKLEA